jgi:hypothetical protein
MNTNALAPSLIRAAPYAEDEIKSRILACPKLASLESINRTLGKLVRSDHTLNSQIAEVIRRDPSLAARLLRMVNSVYFGLSTRVNSIEEAVFFLGQRQIRELAMATPVIDELEQLQTRSTAALPWKDLWTHSIATAMLGREIFAATPLGVDDDTDYLTGLLHNVGKIVMACAFPDETRALVTMPAADPAAFCQLERDLIGWDHGQIGAVSQRSRGRAAAPELRRRGSDRRPRRPAQRHHRRLRADRPGRRRRMAHVARLERALRQRRRGCRKGPGRHRQVPPPPAADAAGPAVIRPREPVALSPDSSLQPSNRY